MGVLLDDVLGDIYNLPCPVFQLLLLPRLDVAVEDLNSMVGDLQLGPA
jgi:predicted secreted protein